MGHGPVQRIRAHKAWVRSNITKWHGKCKYGVFAFVFLVWFLFLTNCKLHHSHPNQTQMRFFVCPAINVCVCILVWKWWASTSAGARQFKQCQYHILDRTKTSSKRERLNFAKSLAVDRNNNAAYVHDNRHFLLCGEFCSFCLPIPTHFPIHRVPSMGFYSKTIWISMPNIVVF